MTAPGENDLFAQVADVVDGAVPDVAESEAVKLAWDLVSHRIRLESTWAQVQTDPAYAAQMRAAGDAIYARWSALVSLDLGDGR